MALTQAQITALRNTASNPAHYGDGTNSTVGAEQFNTQFYIKDALIELAPTMWFTQTASTIEAPKHMGKKLVRYLYLPLLDDRNDNDQGIDASGARIANGNLYGSSRDVNAILKFQPQLTEYGGEVNRVSFKRIKLEGSFEEFGFHYIYTQDSLQFDTDAELHQHNVREAMRGATKICEDRLQIDLINSARAIFYGGEATSRATLTGNVGEVASVVDYPSIVSSALMLDDLDASTNTKVVKGSTYSDTVTINEARLLYVGTPVIPQLMKLKDYHNERAYTEVRQYASATNIAHGEHGAVGSYRVIKVGKDMVQFSAQGALVANNNPNGYRSSLNASGEHRFDVFPMLCVPSETYTTISFKNSNSGSNKFEYYDQAPKQQSGRTLSDPFSKVGFSALSWYYGFMALRPERIMRMEVVAELV